MYLPLFIKFPAYICYCIYQLSSITELSLRINSYVCYLFRGRYDPLTLNMAEERGVSVGEQKEKLDIYRDTPIRYLGGDDIVLRYVYLCCYVIVIYRFMQARY